MKKSVPAASPDAYIDALSGWQHDCASSLRTAVLSAAPLDEAIKWRNIIYFSNGPVAVIRAEPSRVLLGFWRGQLLRDIEPRLKPGGKFDMATIELREGMSVSPATVRELVRVAVQINELLGDPTHEARAR
ncbi:MAG: DUF1801 domain-containing protein [Gemmatimonadota bacterium]